VAGCWLVDWAGWHGLSGLSGCPLALSGKLLDHGLVHTTKDRGPSQQVTDSPDSPRAVSFHHNQREPGRNFQQGVYLYGFFFSPFFPGFSRVGMGRVWESCHGRQSLFLPFPFSSPLAGVVIGIGSGEGGRGGISFSPVFFSFRHDTSAAVRWGGGIYSGLFFCRPSFLSSFSFLSLCVFLMGRKPGSINRED